MRKQAMAVPVVLLALLTGAYVQADTVTVDLLAGQHMDVGSVTVSNDASNLTVTYETTGGWYLAETHLAVADSVAGIPQTNSGNPKVGHFPYAMEHDPWVTSYTYTVPLGSWTPGTSLCVAAHAVVVDVLLEAPYPASAAESASQGKRKNGTDVLPERSDPAEALEPDYVFFSLGFGGSIVVSFGCPIRNGDGNDVAVYEITNGIYPRESVAVEASQNGTDWVSIGTATNGRTPPASDGSKRTKTELDLGSLDWATYIRITDTTDPALFEPTADAFDLDGVEALQDCVEDETAWGDGQDFPGNNWAMCIQYTVQGAA